MLIKPRSSVCAADKLHSNPVWSALRGRAVVLSNRLSRSSTSYLRTNAVTPPPPLPFTGERPRPRRTLGEFYGQRIYALPASYVPPYAYTYRVSRDDPICKDDSIWYAMTLVLFCYDDMVRIHGEDVPTDFFLIEKLEIREQQQSWTAVEKIKSKSKRLFWEYGFYEKFRCSKL